MVSSVRVKKLFKEDGDKSKKAHSIHYPMMWLC
jgi:hypothetical protein